MRALPHAAFAAALLASACGEKPPPAPVVTLGPTADTIPTALSEVTSGAWLGGRRWAVLAAPDEKAVIVDDAGRTVTPARRGQGAAEPGHPVPRRAIRSTSATGGCGARPGGRSTAASPEPSRCRTRPAACCRARGTPPVDSTSRCRPGPAPTGWAIATRPPWSAPRRRPIGPTRSPGWRRSTSPRSPAMPAAGSSAECSAGWTSGGSSPTERSGWAGCTTIGWTGAIRRASGPGASPCPTACWR